MVHREPCNNKSAANYRILSVAGVPLFTPRWRRRADTARRRLPGVRGAATRGRAGLQAALRHAHIPRVSRARRVYQELRFGDQRAPADWRVETTALQPVR